MIHVKGHDPNLDVFPLYICQLLLRYWFVIPFGPARNHQCEVVMLLYSVFLNSFTTEGRTHSEWYSVTGIMARISPLLLAILGVHHSLPFRYLPVKDVWELLESKIRLKLKPHSFVQSQDVHTS
jgi:hypothetical protein